MNPFKNFLEEKGISEDDFKNLDSAKQASLYAEYHEKSIKAIREALEDKANADDLPTTENLATKDELKNLLGKDEFKTVESQVNELVTQMKAVRDSQQGQATNVKSFDEQLKAELERVLPDLKKMRHSDENRGKELVLTIDVNKDPSNVLTTAITNQTATPVNYVYGQVTQYAEDIRKLPFLTQFLDSGSTDKPTIPYMDKIANEGNMTVTNEGALKPLISFSFKLRYSTAKKIAGRTKVSEEALDDIPNLMSIIRNELKYEHDIAEQAWLIGQVNTAASSFVAGTMAGSTDDPSNWDALRAAAYSVKVQSKGRFIPNLVILRSQDAYNMGATKDTTGQYVLPAFVLPDGSKVAGMRVFEIQDDTVSAGDFIVGDLKKFKHRMYKGFTIRIGQGIQGSDTAEEIVSDFESNMYTIIGESRQHGWIYENEKTAFIKASFASVKTSIETPEETD